MSRQIVVVGTDTGVGKTVFSAGLANCLGANYWKPVQAGLEGETDAQLVERLGCLDADRILPELYRLQTPASPHHSAELEGIRIDTDLLKLPKKSERPLVIEGAGGVMVPLSYGKLFIDVFEEWQLPIVLCASTRLGTINHSLLSLEALRKRQIRILGIAFIGERNPESESAICEIGRVRWLGRLPWLSPLTSEALQLAFKESFLRDDFLTL
ncbi:dethiobiotin synthase [Bradyrhizobium canariense]|uniref:ATP-dependent dethiobiotin synthetase BioD n=1 Tax=Bradyrhizobium canariense TaxID=255045 RepID=A0A1X3FPI7_9BRAD|nr:dethiobiotin synthase [Bradyrhizobium canariense]OSI68648.1 dethiobiotin synthase [Bradyrhizobium canariense]OSI78096.1 dethiobiotin synthase [Bradyrhizobium canariense]OSI89326.1 dethiobiotin synthase [Bradyrhizobium canariense]OSI93156.1 dethiobiotin synthase [Bradyrhizobium canariense]OSJ03125.1 dethiobiotin synthase [Bradyrhizobium canariense]